MLGRVFCYGVSKFISSDTSMRLHFIKMDCVRGCLNLINNGLEQMGVDVIALQLWKQELLPYLAERAGAV